MQTIAERVIAAVTLFEGYSASFYCDVLHITRAQFLTAARANLQRYRSRSGAHTYYLKNSPKYPVH